MRCWSGDHTHVPECQPYPGDLGVWCCDAACERLARRPLNLTTRTHAHTHMPKQNSAAILLGCAGDVQCSPPLHSRRLLTYDPSGLHLVILGLAFAGLVLFCFLFRDHFLPMKYKKIVEDGDPFFMDHWTKLCKHNVLGSECAQCAPGFQQGRSQSSKSGGSRAGTRPESRGSQFA